MSELPFSPEFLARLERLALVARRTLRGTGLGERRSKRHGGTVEFADYRGYTPGDEPRRIDWYAYARLEQLFLKLYLEEQDLVVHLLIDQSASMGVGTPSKLDYARQLGVALAYVALSGGDRVTARVVRAEAGGRPLGPLRGRAGLVRLLRFLAEDPQARGGTSFAGAVTAFLSRRPEPGLVLVLTDLLDPAGWQTPLARLRHAGLEPHLIHVVTPEEEEPQVGQDAELVDVETGQSLPVTMDRPAVQAYRAAWAGFCEEAARFSARHGIGYARARTDTPLEELVLGLLRRQDLVR